MSAAEAGASRIRGFHHSGPESLQGIVKAAAQREAPYIITGDGLIRRGVGEVLIGVDGKRPIHLRTACIENITLGGAAEPNTPGVVSIKHVAGLHTENPPQPFEVDADRVTHFSYHPYNTRPPLEIIGTGIKLHEFHSGLLIATGSDLADAKIRGVVIAQPERENYHPTSRIVAVVADLEREELTFWIKGQNPNGPILQTATFSTQDEGIEFLSSKPQQQQKEPSAVA